MGLASREIPMITDGVSQKPPALIGLNQCVLQENGVSSINQGLFHRPPSSHLADLGLATGNAIFVHPIDRNATEKYLLIIDGVNAPKVYDSLGNAKTVNMVGVTAPLGNPSNGEFKAVSLKDYTLILNKSTLTTMKATVASGTLKGTKQTFNDLATLLTAPVSGDVWQISGMDNTTSDAYYVKYDGSVWNECVLPGVVTDIEPTSMPTALLHNSDGTFTYTTLTYNPRVAGDMQSVPNPGFIGRKITDFFFHKNRMGFVSDEKIVFSRSGDLFNFFPQSVINVLDEDPINASILNENIAVINHATATNDSVILHTDKVQFVVSSGGQNLTQATISINPLTTFSTSRVCPPVLLGSNMYLPVDKGSHFKLSEFFVYPNSTRYDSLDITLDVPKYVPKGIFHISSYELDNTLFMVSPSEASSIYVYRTMWQNGAYANERVQKSWSKWILGGSPNIAGQSTLSDYLYLLVNRVVNGGTTRTFLERIPLQADINDSGLDFQVRRDRKVSLTGVFSGGNTTWTLPYSPQTLADYEVIYGGNKLTTSTSGTNQLIAVGNYSASPALLGTPYTFKFQYPPQYLRDQQSGLITHSDLKLRNLDVKYGNSGSFQVVTTPVARASYTRDFSASSMETGKLRVPIGSDGELVTIQVLNSSHKPCYITGAEWEGIYSVRSQRL